MNTIHKFIKQLNITAKDVDELEKVLKNKKLRVQMLKETKVFLLDFLASKHKEKAKKREKVSAQTKIADVYKKIKQL